MYTKRKPHSKDVICNSSRVKSHSFNPMNPKSISGDDYLTIGERSLMALERGVDIGATIVPEYDSDSDSFEMDINCDWHHDAFDIAEKFGRMNVDSSRVSEQLGETNSAGETNKSNE